jgi:MoxR-like ATPase
LAVLHDSLTTTNTKGNRPMTLRYYMGEGKRSGGDVPDLPRHPLTDPALYRADVGLRDACNVALYLRQPLLLTGEPGTGKTHFAHSVAWELGLGDPLRFETKSNSTARDLFYTYDAIRRYHAMQSGINASILDYLTYQPLGLAILRTRMPDDVQNYRNFEHTAPCRSVVLIDEIDKSPRDFPNDILNEVERFSFRIPELDNEEIQSDDKLLPILIMTSNSEKDLPDAFLRRCVYYDIPFPDKDRLEQIVIDRLGTTIGVNNNNAFLKEAVEFFLDLRSDKHRLRKKPATAELLQWLLKLRERGNAKQIENPMRDAELVRSTLGILVKTREDQRKALELVEKRA